jgi:hypothetical protein
MKKRPIFGLLLLMIFFSGCWAPKSIMTTANITQPVLVGNVKTIGGKKIDNPNLQEGTKFSAAIVNSMYYWSSGYYTGSRLVTEGSNVIDEQLLPLIDTTPIGTTAILIVDQIRFNVKCGYWLFALYSGNKGWLDGIKYSGNTNIPK